MHSKIPLLSIRRGIDKVFSIQMNNKKSYRGTYLRTHENRYPWQLFLLFVTAWELADR